MGMVTYVYGGVLQAGAPITHGQILPEGWDDFHGSSRADIRNKNHTFLRTLPVMTINGRGEDTEIVFKTIYAVSGNSIRHRIRELLTDYTLECLEIPSESLEPRVAHLLYSGGVQQGGVGQGADYEAIDERALLRKMMPIVDLFGGVFNGHFFEGALRVHFALPLVRNLSWLYPDVEWYFQEHDIPWDSLPTLEELNVQVINNPIGYTRSLPEQVADIDWGKRRNRNANRNEGENTGNENSNGSGEDRDNEARGIYTVDALPIGTLLAHRFTLLSLAENSKVCFDAGLELLFRTPYIGSQSGKGHGLVIAEYRCGEEKVSGGLENYTLWLEENKKDLVDYIAEIPRRFPAKAEDYGKLNKKEPNRRKVK